MNLYTIGFTQKSAEEFFGLIGSHKIEKLIDIRLNNKSQLAGFTMGRDLPYFLKSLCSCQYEYCPEYAPKFGTNPEDLYLQNAYLVVSIPNEPFKFDGLYYKFVAKIFPSS